MTIGITWPRAMSRGIMWPMCDELASASRVGKASELTTSLGTAAVVSTAEHALEPPLPLNRADACAYVQAVTLRDLTRLRGLHPGCTASGGEAVVGRHPAVLDDAAPAVTGRAMAGRLLASSTRTRLLAILSLPATADEVAVKMRFRELAKMHHPDVNPGCSESAARFLKITDAYQRLVDEDLGHADDADVAAAQQQRQDPAMQARWNIRRKVKPAEYPAWFTPPPKEGDG